MNHTLCMMDPPDVSKLLPLVVKAVKISQELPSENTPAYVYYNDFPRYKTITSGQSRLVLSIIQKLLDLLDARTNVVDMPSLKIHRDKFESIVDANDRLLERLSVAMDIEEDPARKSSSPGIDLVLATHYKQNTSLKWLKPKTEEPRADSSVDTSSDVAFTLLSSPNINRPQSYFSTPVDNSPTPFRPKLVYKPNSIVPLSDSTTDILKDAVEYSHPYQVELEHFTLCINNWEPLSPESFVPRPLDSAYEFVDRLDQLQSLIKEMSIHRAIAVDLEHHNFRTYLGMTCLIQITTPSKDYVIDALALRDHLVQLNEVFTNPNIVKIFHGSDQDLMWLQRDFSVYVVNLFDSHLASRVLQLGRHSLSYLLHHYVNVQTNKKYQLADWRIRPLPEALVEYARIDTHYLLYIAAVMCRELQDRGLLPVVLEQSRQLCLKLYKKPAFDPVGYLRLYKQTAGISFTHRQLYALEHLYALRDSIARREDESVHYVLPNHMLKVIAEVLPRESSGLFACCNPIPPLVRKYVHDLHKIVLDARNRPIEELPITEEPKFSEVEIPSEAGSTVTDASLEQAQPEIATPHDRSHAECSRVALPYRSATIPAMKNPSALGRNIGFVCPVFSVAKSSTKSSDKTGFPLFLDANRMLLTKLLTLLKSRVSCLNRPESTSTKNKETSTNSTPLATNDPSRKTTAESIIKLDFDSSDLPSPGTSSCAFEKSKSTQDQTKEYDMTCSPVDQSFNPDEVVILREEVI
ncbi:Exosome component 10 [Fasciolopsis buskii]|uniref:Exosome component 10 n=1 Tax=Fasciolopsis buskii TaxID=27845 RepID=A0A8E0S2B4_9TREM|nr:Exosome component 10 [Fasciolopsis buski]